MRIPKGGSALTGAAVRWIAARWIAARWIAARRVAGVRPAVITGSLAIAAAGLSVPDAADAIPRYSMVVGQNCNLCHTNPTGGGLRDAYATQYLLPTRLAMQLGEPAEEPTTNPQISDDITVGVDLRTMWLNDSNRDAGNNFRQMQGSLYLSATLGDPRFAAYLHQDFGLIDEAVEVWARGYVLPASGWIKAGRFVPAFGWKWADHRSFTRRDFLFLPIFPPHSDTGIEVGFAPGNFTVEASVTNGDFLSDVDRNDSMALATRGSYRWVREPVAVVIGGSWYTNETPAEEFHAVGPFASVRWGRFIWLGEMDWRRGEPVPSGTAPAVWGLVSSHEFSLRLVQGLDLVGTYDFYDPDTDLQTGAASRIGIGVDALCHSYLKLSARVNRFQVDSGARIDGIFGSEDYTQTILQAQFLY